MNILSIQSWVAFGHVGNASAMFPLQHLGAEVWAVHTVQFSNHPGYGDFAGRVGTGEEIAALVAGIARRGVLAGCDAVLSGYMGGADAGAAILAAVERVRAANPAMLYCCDPVIGDDGPGVYVDPALPPLIAGRAVPLADILTPNQFELGQLTGAPAATGAAVAAAVAALQARMRPGGPRCVLLTSLRDETTPADAVDLLAAEAGAVHRLRTPLLPLAVNGAGDLLAALFLFHRLATGSAAAALERAAASLFGVLRETQRAGARELQTVAARNEFTSPSVRFACESR